MQTSKRRTHNGPSTSEHYRPFLDAKPPVEVRLSMKHLQQDGAMRKHQRDMGLSAHALTTGLEDLERASVCLMRATEAMEDGPDKEGILVTQKDDPGGDSSPGMPGPCISPDGFTIQ